MARFLTDKELMERDFPRCLEVFETFHKVFGEGTMLAGGALRDEDAGREPKDYDIYLTSLTQTFLTKEVPGWERRFPRYEANSTYHVRPVFEYVKHGHGDLAQVMVCPVPTLQKLLDSFDWELSCWGWDGQTLLMGQGILDGEDLRLQKVQGKPAGNLRRGFRFAERYGMNVDAETLRQLCGAVVKEDMERGNLGNLFAA